MFWPQIDPARCVDFRVIPRQRVQTTGAAFGIKATAMEDAPGNLHPLHGSTGALVRDDFAGVANRAEGRGHGRVENVTVISAVMWQVACGIAGQITLLLQPSDMGAQRLPGDFVVVDNPHLFADDLENPDGRVVGLGAGAADVLRQRDAGVRRAAAAA